MKFWQVVEKRLDGRPWSWLAKQAGIDLTALYSARGHEAPSLKTMGTIAAGLGVPLAELITEMEEENG